MNDIINSNLDRFFSFNAITRVDFKPLCHFLLFFFLKKQNFPSGAMQAIHPNLIGLFPTKVSNLI